MRFTQSRAAGVLAASTAVALVLSACDSEPVPSSTPVDGGVTISVAYWGQSGIAEDEIGPSLEEQYEASKPWIDLELIPMDSGNLHELLIQSVTAGSGAPSIVIVDETYITEFIDQADEFVNLLDLGAGKYQENYLPWKWASATNEDGSVLIGLGADVGGLALCYRRDLFQEVGLPNDRDAVSAMLGDSWQDFITVGEEYVTAGGHPFVDNAASVFHAALTQLGTGYAYYDRDNELDMESVKPAFDLALDVIEAGLSAKAPAYSPAWQTAYENGNFGVAMCPSWGLGVLESAIPVEEFVGQWDIADIPGDGGNWGGSFYTIPKFGTANQQQEAYDFIEWLIQEDQQLKIMKETGKLPSQIALLESAPVQEWADPFFNNAPYGGIYAKSILDVPGAIYYAPHTGDVGAAIEDVLDRVEAGQIRVEDAWDAAVAAAETADRAASQ